MNRRKKGLGAENFAKEYLEHIGYKILGKNYCIRGGEIDIIAEVEKEIVFVEVKSLANEDTISLEETVTEKKTKSLIRASKHWLKTQNFDNIDWRIDFIGLIVDNGKIKKLKHLQNAIY